MTTTTKGQSAQDPTNSATPADPGTGARRRVPPWRCRSGQGWRCSSSSAATASAITSGARLDAIDTLERARSLADFLGWVASVRELEQECQALRDDAPPGDPGSLPATAEFTETVSDGHQWAFFHLGELLDHVRAALDPQPTN